ncbi:MAG: hypothetical protein Tsb009_24780 [Planctomycetaceae bacterium]
MILADRRTIQRLRLARTLIEKKNYSNAIIMLQHVVERERDAFYYPDPEKRTVLKSVRLAAQQMIGAMPKAGRDAYHLKYGILAKQQLDDATQKGDWKRIADVARRYFHTSAGYEAMYRLGIYYADRSQPLAAAACFEKIHSLANAKKKWEPVLSLRTALCWQLAGIQSKSQEALKTVLQIQGQNKIVLAGQPVELFQDLEEGPSWLAQNFPAKRPAGSSESSWLVFRGDESRTGHRSLPIQPVRISWSMTTITDPTEPSRDQIENVESAIQVQLKKTVQSLSQQNRPSPVFPQMNPVATSETLVVRTMGCLRAVNLKTGKRIWESVPDNTLEDLLTTSGQAPIPANQNLIRQLIDQRLYSDLTWGTLSSDGERVYAVEELGSANTLYDPVRRTRIVPHPYNRLVAYDLQTGRISWTVGGSPNDSEPDSQAGTFFLGTPLPLAGRLYCLAEVGREIRLMAYEHTETGQGASRRQTVNLVWSQPLVGSNFPITTDRQRRMSGIAVSHADGILVCPTDSGYVIAIDLVSRSLLWGYRYEPANGPRPPRPFPQPRPQPQSNNGWVDSVCNIQNGKVLVAQPGTNKLVCLNLLTGDVLWKRDRGDGRFIAGIRNKRIVVIGNKSVRALNLSDGTPGWKSSRPIPTPSGRGIMLGEHVFIPLSTSEILVLDLQTGTQVARFKTPSGRKPGNLIYSRAGLISQNENSIELIPLPREMTPKKTAVFQSVSRP